jgi:hypothetical protein
MGGLIYQTITRRADDNGEHLGEDETWLLARHHQSIRR